MPAPKLLLDDSLGHEATNSLLFGDDTSQFAVALSKNHDPCLVLNGVKLADYTHILRFVNVGKETFLFYFSTFKKPMKEDLHYHSITQ